MTAADQPLDSIRRPSVHAQGFSESTAESFRWIGATLQPKSPLMAALARHAADDAAILEIAQSTAAGQNIAILFMTVVRYLLSKYPRDPLAAYFPDLASAPQPGAEAYPAFHAFCVRHADAIRTALATRTLQMTAAERAAPLLIALLRVGKFIDAPLNLIEIGCSAGLLLQFDRYHYDFGDHGTLGAGTAPVSMRVHLDGPAAPLLTSAQMPRIARRVGIDLQPQCASDPEVAAWLQAAVFPEWGSVQKNLQAALDIAAAAPPEMVQGDALLVMPQIAAQMQGPLCVYHSHCLYQWPQPLREALEVEFCKLSQTRTLHRLSIESAGGGQPCEIVHMQYRGGELISGELLGHCDNFGLWTEIENF